ncbi:prolipoprotein diacylglyceryl transferase family protein [Acinetobacter haemolyticus]|uniref:prolipoprotein diacylglyceryl transferase family protein n=1 Tax=Acinetobacter haemolyticus TaxID=29430 RepID=UPI00031B8B62|nr:prolipoprotein diacylglyceryl transferase family protein [Acinetobacter haemolyticus]
MISSQALHLGMFMLPWSVLILLFGLIGLWGVGKYFKQRHQWANSTWQCYKDSLWTAIWVGLLAARVVFVMTHADLYLVHPIDIVKIQDRGFNFYAGIIAGSSWFIWKNRLLKMPVLVSSFLLFITFVHDKKR